MANHEVMYVSWESSLALYEYASYDLYRDGIEIQSNVEIEGYADFPAALSVLAKDGWRVVSIVRGLTQGGTLIEVFEIILQREIEMS